MDLNIEQITISLNSPDPEEYERIMGLSYKATHDNLEYLIRQNKGKMKVKFSIVAAQNDMQNVNAFKEKYEEYGDIRVIKMGKWIGDESSGEIGDDTRETKRSCDILYRTINILCNGDMALCCFDSEGIIHKNVLDEGILKIWQGDPFNRLRKHHIRYGITNGECENCSFR